MYKNVLKCVLQSKYKTEKTFDAFHTERTFESNLYCVNYPYYHTLVQLVDQTRCQIPQNLMWLYGSVLFKIYDAEKYVL